MECRWPWARTDLLSPREIARRLADRFEILDSGPRNAPQRQRSLRDAVEWSVGLLEPAERSFFGRLSVFAGGFDIEAAAAVTGTEEAEALSTVGRLVQRSLVTRQASVGGDPRFRLLETLRLDGVEQLAAEGELERVRDLHLNHYEARIVHYNDLLMGSDQAAAFEALVAEQDNLRAAMAWSLESERLAPGILIAAWSGRFWDWRGNLAEGGTWTTRFLDSIDDEATPNLPFLVSWAGYVAWEFGDEEPRPPARRRFAADRRGSGRSARAGDRVDRHRHPCPGGRRCSASRRSRRGNPSDRSRVGQRLVGRLGRQPRRAVAPGSRRYRRGGGRRRGVAAELS